MSRKWSQEDIENWKKWKEDKDQEAGNYMIRKYIPLVDYVVGKMTITLPHTVQRDDLKSYAFQGLLDAIEKFDLERAVQFDTYAMWRIKGAIIDGLRSSDWLPRSTRDKIRKIEEAYTILEQKELRSVTDYEISQFLGMSEKEVNQVAVDASLSALISIDETNYEDEEYFVTRAAHIINEEADSPEKHIHQQFIKKTIAEVVERLPEKEKIVVSLYYFEELNLTEIANILKLSTSRISQLHSKAILRIQAALVNNKEQIYQI